MEFKKTLLKRSKSFYVGLALLSGTNALLNAGLLMFVSASITKNPLPFPAQYGWLVFAGLVGFSFLCNRVFQVQMIHLTNELLLDFTLNIFQKLRLATYETFEKLGNERVFTAINDSRVMGSIPTIFMSTLNALVTVVCCIAYLFWISVVGGTAILLIMALLLAVYLTRNQQIEKEMNQLRDLHNTFYKYVSDLLHGFREIKMNTKRNDNLYHNYIVSNRIKGVEINTVTSIKYLDNELTGTYSWHIVLGIIIFVLPALLSLHANQVTALVVTILYLIGPSAILITLIPNYTNIKIAVERLNDFDRQVNDQIRADPGADAAIDFGSDVASIRFDQVTYEYFDEQKQKLFSLGPIDLEVHKGEIVFIVGGNGSGKSTFVHLLTGLYKPSSGSIFLNGRQVLPQQYAAYSNAMSAIFTNHHLFSENYDGFDLSPRNQVLMQLAHMMQLEEVLRINGNNTIDTKLSKGQQKRLAMVYALMEDKQMVVLDEWAAEQDPQFRKYFYECILQKCQESGKTVFAVTHDDAYFPCADRVIKLDFGKIVQDEKIRHARPVYAV